MFSLIESRDQVARAQSRLQKTIEREFKRSATKDIGYPGGSVPNATVRTDGKHWYRSAASEAHIPNPRCLNWFGLFKDDTGLGITVEVNTAYEGRNNQVAGFFARDGKTGAIYLMHSGRVGGGTKGVGKSEFLAWSNQRLWDVADSKGGIRKGVLVMPIEGAAASRSGTRYIAAISAFKQAVRNGELRTRDFARKRREWEGFHCETKGRRKGSRSNVIDYLPRHPDVVYALHSWRKDQGIPNGSRLVNSVYVDLGIKVGQEWSEVFEVKTSTARSDVYCAIGQLLVHGSSSKCRRVIVLPHDEFLSDDLVETLRRLHIELLRFRLTNSAAVIV